MSKWKLDENGHVVLKNGDPVLTDESGNELIVSGTTVIELRNEAKAHRLKAEQNAEKIKAYEGLDPEAARKALELTSKLDAKQLVESGKVDELRSQITAQFSAQLSEKEKAYNDIQSRLNNMMVDSVFSSSEFVRNSVAIPNDIFKDSFSKHFKVEKGELQSFDKAGNRILSRTRAGEYASPDEALQILVESHPQKAMLLKADVGAGSGSSGGSSARGQGRTMSRSEFEKLLPNKQAEIAGKLSNGEMSLTD